MARERPRLTEAALRSAHEGAATTVHESRTGIRGAKGTDGNRRWRSVMAVWTGSRAPRRCAPPFVRAYVAARPASTVVRMCGGTFDEDLLLTIVENALYIGPGGRLRVVLSAAERIGTLAEVAKAVTWLRTKGIEVMVSVEPSPAVPEHRRQRRRRG